MADKAGSWRRVVGVAAVVALLVGIGLVVANYNHAAEFIARLAPGGQHSAHSPDDGHDHGEGAPAHGGHAHGGDGPTVATTVWAEQADVFLERPYAVAGHPIEMLVHVTVIRNGEPVTEGSLTVEAEDPDGSRIRVCEKKVEPARTGIFIPEITFPKPGIFQTWLQVESPQLDGGAEKIELPKVKVYMSDKAALAAFERAEEAEAAGEIAFLKEQQWRIGLTTVEVGERELVERLVAPGRVIAPPGAGAVVNSPVPGRIAPPPGGRFVQVGEKVEQGRLLGLIEPAIAGADAVQLVANQAQLQSLDADLAIKQLDLETQIRNAELAVARAQDVHDRKNNLVEQGIIPGKDLLLAQHELALAEGRLGGLVELRSPYASARQRLSSVLGQMQSTGDVGQEPGDMRVTLRSPIAGTVVEVATTSGELTAAGEKLFRILNLDTLWIEANISEYDLANVQQAPGASYRLAAYPDQIVSIADRGGHLIDVGAEVDPDTRTVPIRYEVVNHDGLLRVGMFADLLVETRRREKALAVPNDAIMDEAGQAVVYVQLGGESFQRRPVRLGIRDADLVEIREGLTAGERVATKGAYSVRLATLSKQTIGHGHTH